MGMDIGHRSANAIAFAASLLHPKPHEDWY
jgi:hypothetical protein